MTGVTYQELKKNLDKMDDDCIVRLVYVSKIAKKYKTDPKLFKHIEKRAYEYNQKNLIHGFLCNDNTYFLQCLEGSKKAILPLMAKIIKDKRHYNVKVILNETIQLYEFTSWTMRSLYLDQSHWETHCQYPNCVEFNSFLPLKPLLWQEWYIKQFLLLMKNFESLESLETTNYTLQYNTLSNKESRLVNYLESFTLSGLMIALCVMVSAMFITKYL